MEGSLSSQLSRTTFVFGLHLWVLICIGVGALILLILLALVLWLTSRSSSRQSTSAYEKFSCCSSQHSLPIQQQQQHQQQQYRGQQQQHQQHQQQHHHSIPVVSKEIQVVVVPHQHHQIRRPQHQIQQQQQQQQLQYQHASKFDRESRSSSGSYNSESQQQQLEMRDFGWGRWYSLQELDMATSGFCDDSKIGEGGYGVVFKGYLPEGTVVAVKNLLSKSGQAEKEFLVEVEAIGKVRHKNLVRMLGYCAEGSYRMLVYEYVDNGNLEEWLHGPDSQTHAFPWDSRMKIALGTAKALTYLHEALEPKVVHRDIKASNILVDSQWNAKISDFGLAKLLGSEKSHVTTRVMGTFGYVAPEYASTGLLNERSDVYSFGVLLMELITGRDPVDYSRPPGEVNLVDWLKLMVANRHSDDLVDPRLQLKPSPRALKKALLVAIRCVDPDAIRRPKMGHVVHMLEADELPHRAEERNHRERREAERLDNLDKPKPMRRKYEV